MILKSIIVTLFASLSLFAIAGSADAQSLGTWSRTAPGGATEAVGAPSPEFKAGQNYFHATNCIVLVDGPTTVVCVAPVEGGLVCSANSAAQNAMLAACQTGNFLAIYIPDLATGIFTNMVTFTSK